jgi:hypothetical protein
MNTRTFLLVPALFVISLAGYCQSKPASFSLSKEQLQDKIKGGWAGQTIGVTFGGPYEFRFNGTFIGDYQALTWYNGYLKKAMLENPGLYDDLYMDLTFVDVFNRYGLDAPVDSFAHAFAHAGYMLWHANQAARYNLLNGMRAPASGSWQNNPHADCIDYQIESDFAGLMSPGMPNTASSISDKIGHIMNYGDGWYGGVFVGAMYSLAFVSPDIPHIVKEALKTIPAQSDFHQCIQDVINWHAAYPNDWKRTWFEVQKKWANDIGCPDGVFVPFNIDAKVNAAYVTIGLLYGNGDYTRTLEITTRCGQDADCNPSTAGGILGTVLGYNRIPAYWKQGLTDAEVIPFKYTTISLNDVYNMGFDQALKNIERNGGKVTGNNVTIALQQPATVKFEKSFPGLYPKEKKQVTWSADGNSIEFDYEGTGFVLRGESARWGDSSLIAAEADLFIDSKNTEHFILPMNFTTRRHEICWKYELPEGRHTVEVRFTRLPANFQVNNLEAIIYSGKKIDAGARNMK